MQESTSVNKIIGGMFGLQATVDSEASFPSFLNDRGFYLLNARSAIWLLTEHLAPRQVWCPSYLCIAVLDAIKKSKAQVRFYEVTYDLAICSFNWLDQVQAGDLVILIDYFGFNSDSDCAVQAKERGAWVLEDASQALLSGDNDRFSDFVVYSPKKFVGVPDGGILCINHNIQFQDVSLETPSPKWWLSAVLASLMRREFDIYGGAPTWFELGEKNELNSPIGPFAMSELSKVLLQNSFDYSRIARSRVDNYRILADKLSSLALFPFLPDRIIPLGFPIHTKRRDEVRQALFSHKIYPPVHWPIQGVVPEQFGESHKLASEIMTLPCDQRYDLEDMDRIARLVAEALKL